MKKTISLVSLFLFLSIFTAVCVHLITIQAAPESSSKKNVPVSVVLDRFEGRFAVVELPGRRMVNLPRVLIPQGSREGCVLRISRVRSGKNQP